MTYFDPAHIHNIDDNHILHAYSALNAVSLPIVEGAEAASLLLNIPTGFPSPIERNNEHILADPRVDSSHISLQKETTGGVRLWVIDGMSSWWAAIHGYRHKVLDAAVQEQISQFSHVMFGGLTHQAAAKLTQLLLQIVPTGLETVFYSDSGSIGVEVALKMAKQYWITQAKPEKKLIMTWKGGYHGDTFETMSVCDPDSGMHAQWAQQLHAQIFAPCPPPAFSTEYMREFEAIVQAQQQEIAAIIIEPIVQGAGGMRFHPPEYVAEIRRICDKYGIIMIADEVATGFGRTGSLFACDQAGINPDILIIGKALTGGYMSLAATLCNAEITQAFSRAPFCGFFHGPTFMANPLACAVAYASTNLLLSTDWAANISRIQQRLQEVLFPARNIPAVREVRILGAVGVIECHQSVDLWPATQAALSHNVWIRPYRNLIYAMPPYVITDNEIEQLGAGMLAAAHSV